jgi:hypothetical protein
MENTQTALVAASTPHVYDPATKLDICEWTSRFQDALAETAPVGELVRRRTATDAAPEPDGSLQEGDAGDGSTSGPVGEALRFPEPVVVTVCEGCGEPLGEHRPNAHYHDANCKQRAYRERTKAAAA